MWAGHCPAEEHRLKKELPTLLSTSPTEATLLVVASQRERRTRLDTLGSIRPETPLSLSDSELEQLTSPDASDEDAKDAGSSSDDNSDDDEATPVLRRKIATSAAIPTLPPNIHPVRSHIRKVQVNNKCSSIKMASVTSMADHSYSHSDHSYHTQRRPNDNAALVDLLGIQTPSDSEEEIDVVSLGEVLRVSPSSATSGKSCHVTSLQPVNQPMAVNAPIRLKLKVTPASSLGASGASSSATSTTVLMRKALPSHPSALVRQQLQLAVATAAQQRKHSDSHHTSSSSSSSSSSSRKSESKSSKSSSTSGSSSGSSSKRARTDSSRMTMDSGTLSPRKRSSRAGGSDSEDSCEKRSQHNSMERQRRVDLRNAFEFLRSLIPDLEATDRAAKVVILKKAANFCQGLTQREKQFVSEKDALQKRQEILRKRLALLQRRR